MSKYESLFKKVKNDKSELFNILSDFSSFGITKTKDINKLSEIRDKYPNYHQSILKTFDEWNKLGYRIKTGSKGTKLYKGKEEVKTYFDIKQVYAVKEQEKPIVKSYLKDATILIEKGKESGFYDKYIKDIREKVNSSLDENERIIVEDFVTSVILDRYDYYRESTIFNKDDSKKMTLETIEVLKSKIYENPDIFDKIIDETARLSNEIISNIFYEAKDKNLLEVRYYNKDSTSYKKLSMEERKESETNDIRRSKSKIQGTGNTTGKQEGRNLEDGRYGQNSDAVRERRNMGEDTRSEQGLHRSSEQLSRNGERIYGTEEGTGRSDEWSIRHNGRNENDKDRPVGSRNEDRREDEIIGRRSMSNATGESSLSSNSREEYEDVKRDNERREQTGGRLSQGQAKISEQLEKDTSIHGNIQASNILGERQESKSNNGELQDKRVSTGEQGKVEEESPRSEPNDKGRNATRDNANKDINKLNKNLEEIFNNISKEKVEDKSSTFFIEVRREIPPKVVGGIVIAEGTNINLTSFLSKEEAINYKNELVLTGKIKEKIDKNDLSVEIRLLDEKQRKIGVSNFINKEKIEHLFKEKATLTDEEIKDASIKYLKDYNYDYLNKEDTELFINNTKIEYQKGNKSIIDALDEASNIMELNERANESQVQTINIDKDNFYQINIEKKGVPLGIDKEKFIKYLNENKEVCKNNSKIDIENQTIVAHIYNPYGNQDWFITDYEKDGDDIRLFGWNYLGDEQSAELGYISLNEIIELRGKDFTGRLNDILRMQVETHSFTLGQRIKDFVKENNSSYGMNRLVEDINFTDTKYKYNIQKVSIEKELSPEEIEKKAKHFVISKDFVDELGTIIYKSQQNEAGYRGNIDAATWFAREKLKKLNDTILYNDNDKIKLCESLIKTIADYDNSQVMQDEKELDKHNKMKETLKKHIEKIRPTEEELTIKPEELKDYHVKEWLYEKYDKDLVDTNFDKLVNDGKPANNDTEFTSKKWWQDKFSKLIGEEETRSNTEGKEELLNNDYVNTKEVNDNSFNYAEKFNDNVNAIKTLKQVEKENRPATKEEQEIMAKYVGWGGLSNYCFDEQRANKENYDLVKNLLTEEEYRSAVGTVNDAYFTPDYVVKEIYKKIEEFGFKGGKILEPSCGIGKFFANMPKEIRENSNIVGIEKDSISARISKLLYPSMTIKNKGFEEEKIKNNTYNLIIGNVPFGQIKPYDTEYKKENLLIHDYFINKSLDKLAEGGICAIITSNGTLDKKDDKARSLFSEKANFLGAVRLPVGTFGDAKATTDILFFQKDTKNKLGLNQEFVKAEGLYNADKDLIKQKNNIFKNTITKETYTIEQRVDPMQIMSSEMWEDLFVGKTCGGDEPFTKDDYETSYIQVSNYKFAELKYEYYLWVKYGKKPNEKPTYDDTKDLYVFKNNAYLEEVKGLKQIAKYEINVGVENPEYYQIKELKSGVSIQRDKNTEKYLYSKKPLINLETTNDIISNNAYKKQFFDININTYYKNNINNVIGTLQTDTGQYGRPIIVSKIADATLIRNELRTKLKDIHCIYSEPKAKKLEKDTALTYISENEYETNKLYELKKYSHFIFKEKICFKEGDTAYYVNNLNTKKYEQLKALIKLKETTHKILQNEEIGNLDEANSLREVLRDTYNDFYNKYNERINSKNVKSLIAEDDDKGLLLSLEVGNDVEIETYKTKKNAIKKEIPEEEIVEQKTLNNGVEVVGIEDENGKTRYFDKEKNEWIIDTKTEFVLSITENNPDGLAQIFREPLIKVRPELLSVDNAKDGLILSLQTLGKVDIDFIVEKSNLTKEQVINDLKGQIYYDHIQKDYVSKDEFLSGNIIQKIELYEDLKNDLIKENTIYQERLNEAESLKSIDNEEEIKDLSLKIAENNRLIETFEPNINDLKAIIPRKIPFEDIDINLGATWLPVKYYKKFMTEVLKASNYYNDIALNDKISPLQFMITGKRVACNNTVEMTYGTKDRKCLEILESALNLKPIQIYDIFEDDNGKKKQVLNSEKTGLANERAEQIKEAFKSWKQNNLNDEEKQEIEELYNRKYNCFVARSFDGTILDFPGMNQKIDLKMHQRNAIARMVFGRNTGLAHGVGLGKTYEICAGVMKFKQLGLANKSMIVVPKPLVEQWQREFLNLYPTANVIAPTEKDFSKENRTKFLSKISTGNYDAIILSQEQFQKIPLSKDRQERYINQQLDEFEEYLHDIENGDMDNDLKRQTIKDMQREIDNLKSQLEKLNNADYKDNAIDFEELHIDKLFVDEAHYYKNSYFATKLKRVAGIQSKRTLRTYDLQMKCKYLNEKTDYKGVYLATGTPITNSIVEGYTMMKYLQDDLLKEIGIKGLDDYIANFCQIKTDFELDSTGNDYHQKTRVKSFTNAPEFIRLFKESWDVKTLEDLNNSNIPESQKLKVPKLVNGERKVIVLPPTEMQKKLMLDFIQRSKAMQPGAGGFDPHIDNMLKLTNDGKLSALDPRLFDDNIPDDPGTKVNVCVENIVKKYFDTMEQKGTQMIFSDIGVPKAGKKFDIYNDIKKKLIAKGIKENEIAFIGDYDTPEKKQQMQNMMNEGKIRVLLSSTDKGGTGLNVQEKMCAMHHLSLPWKPSDMEQREGRIIRQGNTFNEVDIFTYIQQGTFDARTFEILENKSNFIRQVMKGDETQRRYDNIGNDESCINYDDWVQMALPDSKIKEMKELEKDIKLLEAEKAQFNTRIRENRKEFEDKPKEIELCMNVRDNQIKDVERLKQEKDKPFSMKIYGKDIGNEKVYNEKQDATKMLYERIFNEDKSIYYKTTYTKVAEYKGFEINVQYSTFDKTFNFRLKSLETGYLYNCVDLGKSDVGNMTRIENFINDINDERIEQHNRKIEHLKKEQKSLEESLKMVFDKDKILEEKKTKLFLLHQEDELKKKALEENAENNNNTNNYGSGDGSLKQP